MRIFAVAILMLIITANCYPVERTEAQRYYDLGVSYIKSDLYEKGLDTLNQVAFLYPDSDAADDALYQLALIREQVGDGQITIGKTISLEAVNDELARLTGSSAKWGRLADILTMVNAHLVGEQVFDAAKEQAIVQYLLALDYLNTLFQRYPDSDRAEHSKLAFERIVGKIDRLMQPKPPKSTKDQITTFVGMAIAMVAMASILMGIAHRLAQ